MAIFSTHDKKKTLYGHIAELRKFLIISFLCYILIFGICIFFSSDIYKFLSSSLVKSLEQYKLNANFVSTNLTEIFSVYLKTAFVASLIIFLPIFMIFLLSFVFPMLKKGERKIALILGICVPFLFYSGMIFAYCFSISSVWGFFIKISLINPDIKLMISTIDYLNLILTIMVSFGLSFELPVLLVLLKATDIISTKSILKFSRYAVVLAFIIGAIITPPDPMSQILVASILLFLYYLSFFIIKIFKI